MKHRPWFAVLVLMSAAVALPAPGEGMWPMSELPRLDLAGRGIVVPAKEIFNPGGTGLIDANVQLEGCSGSFVSGEGLILTNHHCVFGYVQAVSTPEHDYLTNGFRAPARMEEIPAKGQTARITESYRDVSTEVLDAVRGIADPAERTRTLERRKRELAVQAETQAPGKRAEVAEMFPGKTYVLFVYTYLRDVRLVYVPPRCVGDYGGEEDNWVWPRHGGDFSFLRAYVGPDGKPADYSPDNVPYRPKVFLRVAPEGVNEGDAVFILGYPGRTYRHQPAAYLAWEEEIRMSAVAESYEGQIRRMEAASAGSPEAALRLAGRIKGLSNTSKNYRGKLAGLRRLGLVEKKRAQEREIQAFIERDPARKAADGALLADIDAEYRLVRERSGKDLLLNDLYRNVYPLRIAHTLLENARERAKPEVERENAYMSRNRHLLVAELRRCLEGFHPDTDRALLRELLLQAARLPQGQRIAALDAVVGDGDTAKIDRWLDESFNRFRLADEKTVVAALDAEVGDLTSRDDPFLRLAADLMDTYLEKRDFEKARKGNLDALSARLMEVKRLFLGASFIPDANSTLRLTTGRVKGYAPRDAVRMQPVTTLEGILEKDRGADPFNASPRLKALIRSGDFGRFTLPGRNTVPVNLLYDADTTGGNSGSALLDRRGRLVGVNFDRAWEATVNDFAWSPDYSRSIGVDIRFVLWVAWKLGGAIDLLREMGVEPVMPRPKPARGAR
ncbi:MAG: S46 family peptidase [Acidobacteria bacterium]|nr:S46 family peptidase [Acidobacteriota bacterium]